MLNSLNACGQTLLDTINHVMDHAKISETKRNLSTRRIKNANTVQLYSKPIRGGRSKDGAFDLGIVTEEVVEAVFSGASYTLLATSQVDAPDTPADEPSNPFPKRKECFIILDLAFEQDWVYSFPVGSWRRIVMNIFGNAIKYTESGFIHVSLRTSKPKSTSSESTITLTISDSGSGMSPTFLANRAFQPFSQENPHATGTGLGLSIIRQIVETNGGKIEISSDSSGTRLIVKMALTGPSVRDPIYSAPRAQFLSFLPRLEGRRICILHKRIAPPSENPEMARIDEGLVKFTNTLVTTLEKHLKMNVVQTTKWEGHDSDIVIVPQLSFDYLHAIRRNRVNNNRAPVTVFVAMDAIEASALRSDARVNNRQSVVEIMTQPYVLYLFTSWEDITADLHSCGPYKLAFVLNRCLDRFALPEENLKRPDSATVSPQPLPRRPKLLSQPFSLPNLLNDNDIPVTELAPVVIPAPLSVQVAQPTSASSTLGLLAAPSEAARPSISNVLVVDDNSINRKVSNVLCP